jgi:hypothetical protein
MANPYEQMGVEAGHYRAVYEAFGPRRLFRGTDITKTPCSRGQCVRFSNERIETINVRSWGKTARPPG